MIGIMLQLDGLMQERRNSRAVLNPPSTLQIVQKLVSHEYMSMWSVTMPETQYQFRLFVMSLQPVSGNFASSRHNIIERLWVLMMTRKPWIKKNFELYELNSPYRWHSTVTIYNIGRHRDGQLRLSGINGARTLLNIDWGNGLLPDDNEPLPDHLMSKRTRTTGPSHFTYFPYRLCLHPSTKSSRTIVHTPCPWRTRHICTCHQRLGSDLGN